MPSPKRAAEACGNPLQSKEPEHQTLFAGLNMLDGSVIITCMQRHRHNEWLKFLGLIDRTVDDELDIRVIADNYVTHKHEKVQAMAQAPPAFSHAFYTPRAHRGSTWLNGSSAT